MIEKVFYSFEELKAFLQELPENMKVNITVEVKSDDEEESTESE